MSARSNGFTRYFAALATLVGTVAAGIGLQATILVPGDQMFVNDFIYTNNGAYALSLTTAGGNTSIRWSGPCPTGGGWNSYVDGRSNLTTCPGVLGTHAGQTASAGSGGFAQMQHDGNFVLYTSGLSAVWSTNTSGYGSGAFLNLQDDGNLVVYYNTNVAVWSTY